MLHKLNFKIKITISLHKNFKKLRLKKTQTKKTNKQTNKRNKEQTISKNNFKKVIPSQPQKDFS